MSTQSPNNVVSQNAGFSPENVQIPIIQNRAPTTSDINYPIGKTWIDESAGNSYQLTSFSTVGGVAQATWTVLGGGSADVNQIAGNTGIATPVGGIIDVVGSGGVSTVASGDTVTITVQSASTTQLGIVELSTDAETIAGSVSTTANTPTSLKAKLGTQTAKSIPYGAGNSSAISWTNALTDGQLVIGSTAGNPAAANLTSTGGSITITNGSNTINLEATVTGDVDGPASSTDNAITRFDGTTGKIIQNSLYSTITDLGYMVTPMFADGTTVQATAGGTTVLTNASNSNQFFSGINFQNIQLPSITTIPLGTKYRVRADTSAGDVLVYTVSGGTLILSMNPGIEATFTSIATSGTEADGWTWVSAPFDRIPTSPFSYACSDETTPITTGIKVTFRSPYKCYVKNLRGSLTTASSSGSVQIDVLQNGTSCLSSPLVIPSGNLTSGTAVFPGVANVVFSDDDEIDIQVTSAGTNAAGLKVTFYFQELWV